MTARMPAAAPGSALPGFVGAEIDDAAFAHRSILASAGSGKTHALTTRYLQLIAAGAAPATILASTFTRLAAGEIRDRVLERLSSAALDERKRTELAAALELVNERDFSAASATSILTRLVRSLHVLQLRTLDSFFASVVRASCIELGLPIGAEVIDEEQEAALRSEAIALMLDERRPDELVELLRQLTRGDAGRSVTDAIDAVVKDLYDLWCEAPAEAWDCVPELPGRLKLPEVVAHIEAIESIAPGRLKSHNKSIVDDVRRARALDWEAFLSNGIACKIARGEAKFSNAVIDPAWIPTYQPLVNHAKAVVIGKLRHQTLATRDMLAHFHDQFARLKRVRGVVTFGDLVLWCQRAIERDQLDTIAFRLDAAVRHLLLDEFQDTSIAQWRALQPIVEEVVSTAPPERSFFCVGDVKQSIYGWRGAAPEVLQEIPTLHPGVEVRTLAKSYRSSPVVIDAVNRVFEGLADNCTVRDHVETVQAWLNGFERHESAHPKRVGFVELRMVVRVDDNGEKGDTRQKAHRLRCGAELAAKLAREHPELSIAVLVRSNANVARVLVELGPGNLDVRASGRGGGPVIDVSAVNVLLDLLRLVDHPEDTTSAFNVAKSPVGAHMGLTDWKDDGARRRTAERMRRDLLDDGVAMTLARLARQIACDCDEREIRRVLQLVELAGQFDEQPSLRMDHVVAMAEQKKIAPTQQARVEVMVIHQAKGLDFDVVILPDLEFKLTGAVVPKIVFEREEETGPITRLCRHIKQEFLDFVPELEPLCERYTRRTVRESLSLLYVAMTRARHAVHMLIDPPRANERTVSRTAANIVRFALAPNDATPGAVVFESGDPEWPAKTARAEPALARAAPIDGPIRFAPPARRAFDRAPSPAELAAKDAAHAGAAFLDRSARERGSALHHLLQQIEWLDAFEMDETALRACIKAKLPRCADDWLAEQVRDFKCMIASPEVTAALSRPAGCEAVVVRREVPFARQTGEGVQTGAIDRLVIEMDGTTAQRATVIDFKTDVVEADAASASAQRYCPQLQAYRDAAAELLGIAPGSVAMKIVFLWAGRVIDVE